MSKVVSCSAESVAYEPDRLVAILDINSDLKNYVDDNVGLLNKKFRRMTWKKRGKYVDKRRESIRREKRWK